MKRLIVLIAVLMLTGCPRQFNAHVDNRSDKDLVFISNNSAQTKELVRAGKSKDVDVSPGCQLVKIGDSFLYIDFSKVPRDAWQSLDSGKKIKFKILYDGTELLLEKRNGDHYRFQFMPSCKS